MPLSGQIHHLIVSFQNFYASFYILLMKSQYLSPFHFLRSILFQFRLFSSIEDRGIGELNVGASSARIDALNHLSYKLLICNDYF